MTGIVYTGAVNTNQTLSTEIPSLTLTTAGRQWATGALTTQREVLITQPTYSFVGASTITDAATLGIAGAPLKSTNATITNTHGLLIQAGAVSTATNSYGLTVNAQTGATNNYGAAFLTGNVGIGTTASTFKLDVSSSSESVFKAVTTTSGDEWVKIFNLKAPNLANGENVQFIFGRAEASGEEAEFAFRKASSGNYVSIGTNGNASLIEAYHSGKVIFNAGNVGIGTTSPNSTLNVVGGVALNYTAKTATYSILATDYTINCTANTFTVTLPTAVSITGRIYVITNSGAGTITIATTTSQTFANVTLAPTTLSMSAVGAITVQSNGANWLLLTSL